MKKLTVAEFKSHFFSSPKYPAWNGDLSRILIGLEVEFLICKLDGRPILKSEAIEIFKELKKNFKYNDSPARGANTFTAAKETEFGFISIKPDFSFNIIEISLPPRGDFESLKHLTAEVISEIDYILSSLNLRRIEKSILDLPNAEVEYLDTPRINNYLDRVQMGDPESIFFNPLFPSIISATQVHLNILDEHIFRMLPLLYEIEWMTIPLFSKCTRYRSTECGHARTLLYEKTFGDNYRLLTVPREIPNSVESYVKAYNDTPQIFSSESFFPVRDYTYIRPRSIGTIEFRSTCSQFSVDEIMSIVAFRFAQLAYAIHNTDNLAIFLRSETPKIVFSRWANSVQQNYNLEYEKMTIERLRECLHIIPNSWSEIVDRLLKRISRT